MQTIQLIDDDESILLLVSTHLRQKGYRVITAGDGGAGLEQFESERPDFVLCDLHMPVLDGLGVLAEVKRRAPFTPFVVFSGTSDVAMAVEALKEGAWDYLIKPLPGLGLLQPLLERLEERARFLREKETTKSKLEEQIRLRTGQLVRQLREKDLLLAEVHHRVKNNLQIILVLLGLQKDHAADSEARESLQAACDRVHALAMVQDEMHDGDHATLVDSSSYVTGVVHHLLSAQGLTANLDLELDVESLSLRPSLAFTCGLVLNELMSGMGPESGAWAFSVRFRALGPGIVELSLKDSRSPWARLVPAPGKSSLRWDLISALAGGPGENLLWDPREPARISVRMR